MPQIEQTVSDPQMAILESTASINLFLAGIGSGKSHLNGIKSYQFVTMFPECTGFIGANFYDQLNTSTFFRIREYWKSIGVTEWSKENSSGMYVSGKQPPAHFKTFNHNFDSYHNIVSFINGAVLFIGSLDNAKSHEGKEFAYAFLDETKDTDEADVKEIILGRMRQKGMYLVDGQLSSTGTIEQQYNPLYITTSPAKSDWINEWFQLDKYIVEIGEKIYSGETFFEKEFDNKKVVISSTYHNIDNVGKNYIDNVLKNNTEERGKALIYANPFSSTGGEFYSSFDRLKHVKEVKYDKTLPLHLSFDQNSVPYNSVSIWQIKKNVDIWEIYCIDEIALENPRNSTEEVCEEFKVRYPNHSAGGWYYGDASGKSRSVMNKDFKHHYDIIAYKLKKYWNNSSDRTCFSNPSVPKRRDFINAIFENKFPLRIFINESCKLLIADLMYLKQDIDGTKKKQIVEDKDTGDKYQKYGHLSDTCFVGETMIVTNKGNKRIDSIKIGDMVLTRNGYRKVLNSFYNGIKEIKTYKIGNIFITCTPDHRFYIDVNNYIAISQIKTDTFCIFESKKICKKKLSVTEVQTLIDIPILREILINVIILGGLILMESGIKFAFMSINGFVNVAQSLMDMKYIINLGILMIMTLIIWNVLQLAITGENITKIILMNIKHILQINSLRLLRKVRKYGMVLRQGVYGIKNMLKMLFMGQKEILFASNVNRNLLLMSEQRKSDFAVVNVNQDTMQEYGVIGKRKVYDIEVEGEHEYFANNILVHNCDYFLTELFKDYYNG